MDNFRSNTIRISGVVRESIVDGPGIRYVLFTQGCPHHCKNCHNPDTHDYNGGKLVDIDIIIKDILRNPLLQGVTISGGDPFVQATNIAILLNKLKEKTNLNTIVFTGFKYDYLLKNSNDTNNYLKLLSTADILIDGKFEETLKDPNLMFRGSSNQEVIDLKKSLANNNKILYKFEGEN